MTGHPDDPRSEAEKARADLKRNAEMGQAVVETPLTRQPSVTPQTFGDHTEQARLRSGTDQGVEAGGDPPGTGGGGSESIAEAEQVTAGRDHSRPAGRGGDADALTRAKE